MTLFFVVSSTSCPLVVFASWPSKGILIANNVRVVLPIILLDCMGSIAHSCCKIVPYILKDLNLLWTWSGPTSVDVVYSIVGDATVILIKFSFVRG